eukprot:scaffold46143_cov26-Tisochrysis_lutea.AAC.7
MRSPTVGTAPHLRLAATALRPIQRPTPIQDQASFLAARRARTRIMLLGGTDRTVVTSAATQAATSVWTTLLETMWAPMKRASTSTSARPSIPLPPPPLAQTRWASPPRQRRFRHMSPLCSRPHILLRNHKANRHSAHQTSTAPTPWRSNMAAAAILAAPCTTA